MSAKRPILYSFRRCPYAMRARMAVLVSGQEVELREVLLRDKPVEMIAASPKATVPVMVVPSGEVIDESLDLMLWVLDRNDPEDWLRSNLPGAKPEMLKLITQVQSDFKPYLDRYKYPERYPDDPLSDHRATGLTFLQDQLEPRLAASTQLFGETISLADIAIFPFVRQFAHTDRGWFAENASSQLQNWLTQHIESALFVSAMTKYPVWNSGNAGPVFGSALGI